MTESSLVRLKGDHGTFWPTTRRNDMRGASAAVRSVGLVTTPGAGAPDAEVEASVRGAGALDLVI